MHEIRLKPLASGLYVPVGHCVHVLAPPVEYVPAGQGVQSLAFLLSVSSSSLNLPLGHRPQTPSVMTVGNPVHRRQAGGASARPSDPLGQRYRLPHAAELVPKSHGFVGDPVAPLMLPGPVSPQHV